MEIKLAKKFKKALNNVNDSISEVMVLCIGIPDKEERLHYQRALTDCLIGISRRSFDRFYQDHPQLMPVIPPDPPLTRAQRAAVAKLTKAQVAAIDRKLLSHAAPNWRKVARIVGATMMDFPKRKGIPDVYYAERVRLLVEAGELESQGNLSRMGFSEVRLPQP